MKKHISHETSCATLLNGTYHQVSPVVSQTPLDIGSVQLQTTKMPKSSHTTKRRSIPMKNLIRKLPDSGYINLDDSIGCSHHFINLQSEPDESPERKLNTQQTRRPRLPTYLLERKQRSTTAEDVY